MLFGGYSLIWMQSRGDIYTNHTVSIGRVSPVWVFSEESIVFRGIYMILIESWHDFFVNMSRFWESNNAL